MNIVYLLLGSNEGERITYIKKAVQSIQEQCGSIIQSSAYYETAAWGINEQPDFINQVIVLSTQLAPAALLKSIQTIEKEAGRQRITKWGQRTLDIDILFYNNDILLTENLKIPHPYLQDRRFTLAPLNEIAPAYVHPILQKTIADLLAACKDTLAIKKIE